MRNDSDPLSLTRNLLAFNTINPPGQERNCAEYLGCLLEETGFRVDFYEFAEGRTSIVAKLNGGRGMAPICFSAHMDTIPLGAAKWSRSPFGGECDGDKIYGRGASDMKGGLAAMVSAALRLARLPGGRANILLVITAGEETGCTGAEYLVSLRDVLGNAGAIVVGEPTGNYPFVGHKGALWLEARTTGLTAHGSMPEKGVNAIYRAVDALTKLKKFDFDVPPHPLLGNPTLNVGTIAGGMNINSVPDQATVGIDIRTVPGQSNQEVYERLQSELGPDVHCRPVVSAASVSTDPENEWVQEVFDIMASFLDERPVPRGATYFTDASFLTPALGNPPTLILGPGEAAMAHKTDEFCSISKIEDAAQAYLEIARRWCGL
jgi:succinyl-diaminopimelate desuccinylase